jgi:hypothetical protein
MSRRAKLEAKRQFCGLSQTEQLELQLLHRAADYRRTMTDSGEIEARRYFRRPARLRGPSVMVRSATQHGE